MILTYDQIKTICYGLNDLRSVKFTPKVAYKIATNCQILYKFWEKIIQSEYEIKLRYKNDLKKDFENEPEKQEQCNEELQIFWQQTTEIDIELISIEDFPENTQIKCATMVQLFPIISK